MQSYILLNMDNHNVTQLVLIDLLAAFDTVDHDILKQILNLSFGASGTALKWIASYVDSRSQRIFIDGIASERFELDQGVPEGSCIGPIFKREVHEKAGSCGPREPAPPPGYGPELL